MAQLAGQSAGSASGEFLLTATTALAIEMSRQLSVEEMELVSAFLEVLGNQLALLVLKMPSDPDVETT